MGYTHACIRGGSIVFNFSYASRQPPFGQSLALFFATGFLTYEFYNKLSNSLMTVIDANKALLLYPIVTKHRNHSAFYINYSHIFHYHVGFYGALIVLGLANFLLLLICL